MAASEPVRFRLVLHRTPEGRSHGDLFVRVGSDRPLLTYEVTRDSLRMLCAELGPRLPHPRSRRETAGSSPQAPRSSEQPQLRSEPLLVVEEAATAKEAFSATHGDRASATPTPVRAVRKGDHRALYWEYSGPISGGRGRIRELIRGKLIGLGAVADPPPILVLCWASENPERT